MLGSSSDGEPAKEIDGGEAGPTDGAVASEGGPVADASRRGCDGLVPAPKLCEDFDRGTLTGWSTDVPDGGFTGIDTTQASSGTGSLRAKMVASPSCTYARIERTVNGVGTKRVELRMRLRPAAPFVDMVPLAMTFDPSRNGCTAIFYLEGSGQNSSTAVNIQHDSKANDVRPLSGRAPTDTWSELVVVATPATSGGVTLAISLGDDGAQPDTHTFPQCTLGPELDLYPGFHCTSGSKEVFLDDLRVYAE